MSSNFGRLPLHEMLLCHGHSVEMAAALLAAYKDADNIADDAGMLPIHQAARYGL
jgi:ankyrin repeat protein